MDKNLTECRKDCDLQSVNYNMLRIGGITMGWTDERIEQLKGLWNEGLSASQIARAIGWRQPECRDRQSSPAWVGRPRPASESRTSAGATPDSDPQCAATHGNDRRRTDQTGRRKFRDGTDDHRSDVPLADRRSFRERVPLLRTQAADGFTLLRSTCAQSLSATNAQRREERAYALTGRGRSTSHHPVQSRPPWARRKIPGSCGSQAPRV